MARIGRWILIILGAIGVAVAVYFVYQNFFAGRDAEPVVDLGSVVTLECSTECASYGQCGTNLDNDLPVVLAGKDEIKVKLQDYSLPVAVDMLIVAKNTAQVKVHPLGADQKTIDDSEPIEVQFWKMLPNGSSQEDVPAGWVADWCVTTETTTDE